MDMLTDRACLQHLAEALFGASLAATGASLPMGATEAVLGGAAFLSRLSERRRGQADAAMHRALGAMEAEWKAWGRHSSHADAGARESAKAAFETVAPRIAFTPAEAAGCNLDPEVIARAVLAKAVAVKPDLYGGPSPHNTDHHLARQFLLGLTERAYRALIAEPGYMEEIAPALWREALERLDAIESKLDALPLSLREREELRREIERLRTERHHTERMIADFLDIVGQAGTPPEEFNRALMRVAIEWERAGESLRAPAASNLTPQLAPLRTEARRAYDEGDVHRAFELIDRLRDEERAQECRLTEEIEAREQARAALRVERARTEETRLELASARLDEGAAADSAAALVELRLPTGAALSDALFDEQIAWFRRARGRRNGPPHEAYRLTGFDFGVGLRLAERACHLAAGSDSEGLAQYRMGSALRAAPAISSAHAETLRRRATGAFTKALEHLDHEEHAAERAEAQRYLVRALRVAGELAAPPLYLDLLDGAVTAGRDALAFYTEENHPKEWAQINVELAWAYKGRARRGPCAVRDDDLRRAIVHLESSLRAPESHWADGEREGAESLLGSIRETLAAPP